MRNFVVKQKEEIFFKCKALICTANRGASNINPFETWFVYFNEG
jgi:hypothetical protein